jgi:hypothetical protein
MLGLLEGLTNNSRECRGDGPYAEEQSYGIPVGPPSSLLAFKHISGSLSLGLLKAKLARYRAQLLEPTSKSGPAGVGFDVQKSGDARVALIGSVIMHFAPSLMFEALP